METAIGKTAYLKGLTARYKDNKYFMEKEEFIIGRSPECDLIMEDETISGQHAKIICREDELEIVDLNSSNGTFVNGEKITQKILRSGDTIGFDVYEFQIVNPAEESRTVPAPSQDNEDIGQTMVRPALEEEQAETTVFPEPPGVEPTVPEIPPPQPPKQSKQWLGISLGLLVSFLIGYGSLFVLTWAEIGFSAKSLRTALASTFSIYPLKHTHPIWTNNPFTVESFLFLLCLLLALLLGGLTVRSILRRDRLGSAAISALFYTVIALIVQLAAVKLNLKAWSAIFSASSIGIQSTPLNILISIVYFWGVSFVMFLSGSFLSNK